MGRHGAAEHPPDRLRPATGRRDVQHRHADRRLDRPDDEAGRDVQPAARLVGRARCRRVRSRAPTADVYPSKINSLFTARPEPRRTSCPGTSKTRGYNGLKAVLGNLYGLDIKYFVEVNFDGFKQVVDALGGVTINVQVPVLDDSYPSDTGRLPRVYIPAGIQHMTGAQALVYARSRHGSDDFDRGCRQQRVLTSLREQADIADLIPRIPRAPGRGQGDGQDGHPAGPSWPSWPGSPASVDTKNIRSYVFSYPRYGTQVLRPGLQVPARTSARIRAAVANAFKVDPQLEDTRAALGQENALDLGPQRLRPAGRGDDARGVSSTTTG